MAAIRNFFVKALNTAPHMVYMIPLATFCTGCALKRHYDRRVDGVERTFKYKKIYSIKRMEDVELSDENRDIYN
ncbi:hypothetical protein P879_03159 [Paragonimus westermani]|uniref:Uncharacterized protein n=1 Tax=Paragonimus westermani TaxID=34504 RepID=A0A8T0DHH2_9TREM|nr:hypothetical protein P879_03159 [Paragonimus westermani]